MNAINIAYSDPSGRNVGIDVGSQQLDIFIHELGKHWSTENSAAGIKQLLSLLRRYKLARILVEATGGYERQLVEACAVLGLPIVIVQPMQVRQYAKAQGRMAKTDKLDSSVIASFAAVMQPEPRAMPWKNVRTFKDLLPRKRQLNEMRTQELNRHKKSQKRVSRSHSAAIKFIEKEITWVNDKLATELDKICE